MPLVKITLWAVALLIPGGFVVLPLIYAVYRREKNRAADVTASSEGDAEGYSEGYAASRGATDAAA